MPVDGGVDVRYPPRLSNGHVLSSAMLENEAVHAPIKIRELKLRVPKKLRHLLFLQNFENSFGEFENNCRTRIDLNC